MAVITLSDICKDFGKVHAVVDLNLEIQDGEFVTLLGPSGCGKTTTLNCIAGLEEVTSGKILFDGQVVNDLSPRDRNVAMVFQDYALYPHMSVGDNLAFGLRMRRVDRDQVQSRVREVSQVLGIGDLLNRRVAEISGGQRQRVALGRAMVRDSIAFLMDEPLSNLDAALRIKTRSEIKALQRELAITTVYVTHDQEEAMVLSDRMAIMNQGRLQQCGTPHETYNDPVNRFVASFIGSPQMNFVEGQLAVQESMVTFGASAFSLDFPIATLAHGPEKIEATGQTLLGIRPEHLHLTRSEDGGHFGAEVFLVEPVGALTYVDIMVDGLMLKISTDPGENFVAGETVRVHLDESKVYYFDAKTGQRQ
jgi:multiple sugar transport system ATP-binding protein